MNPLLKQNQSPDGSNRLTVRIPSSSAFTTEISQADVDNFFASLGYADALPLPYCRENDGLFVILNPSNPLGGNLYRDGGFETAQRIPYLVLADNTIQVDRVCEEAAKAGYGEAVCIIKDDSIPF